MKLRRAVLLLLPLLFASDLAARNADPDAILDAAQLRLAIEKLDVVGSALYIAAHPDDENTALLTWLANRRKVRTAYLSMTRGDGGQNLVGSETGELLGVIRTQELLAARRLDGAEQFFTRALDFGYSKNPEETLAIWERERILADVVWVIRKFQPDVIVTRFPAHQPRGHGHHTASALLAEEAFAAAADARRFPEQLRFVKPWQARRLVWNVFRFGSQGPDTTADRVRVDLGGYDPLLGRSYTEIAGQSRSMHKSQGFGSAERRGSYTNTFEHRLGEPAEFDLFDGVDLTWSRVPGAARLRHLFASALREYRADRPESALPPLLEAYELLRRLPAEPLVARKQEELRAVIRSCVGLWIEAVASAPSAGPGGSVTIETSALERSWLRMRLESVELVGAGAARRTPRLLPFNQELTDTFTVVIPASAAPSRPYWLEQPGRKGSFEVAEWQRIGAPESPPALQARFVFDLAGVQLEYLVPVVYRWTDRVQGERYREFLVAPAATVAFEDGVTLFPDADARDVRVRVSADDGPLSGTLRLHLPSGWRAEPPVAAIALPAVQAETLVTFRVTPPAGRQTGTVTAELESGGRTWSWRAVHIEETHIPPQTLYLPATAQVVRADVQIRGQRVGYLMGSGDAIPEALRQLGFTVQMLEDEDVEKADLSPYDAIVTGVRAYNTRPALRRLQSRLLAYVEQGGRLVVQYNTAEADLQGVLGPYPFTLSRDRVTVEEAPVKLLQPEHPLVTSPNRITQADFAGWVQERGLYFANPWDDRYDTVLSCHDPEEPALDGGLLYARYGKGEFVYTGYSWFRQMPAGVAGAYRLLANLVSATGP